MCYITMGAAAEHNVLCAMRHEQYGMYIDALAEDDSTKIEVAVRLPAPNLIDVPVNRCTQLLGELVRLG